MKRFCLAVAVLFAAAAFSFAGPYPGGGSGVGANTDLTVRSLTVNTSATVKGTSNDRGVVISTSGFVGGPVSFSTGTFHGQDANGDAIVTDGGCFKIGAAPHWCGGPGEATYAP